MPKNKSSGVNKFHPGKPKPSNAPNYRPGVTGGGASKYTRPPVKAGSPNTREASPHVASREGRALGTHTMGNGGREVQRPYEQIYTEKKDAAPLGNDKALDVGRGGPGADRTIYRSGSQGQHGPVRQGEGASAGRRDILSEYGPESKGR
jgi:hypothetical protein